jgi:hypothetical protein
MEVNDVISPIMLSTGVGGGKSLSTPSMILLTTSSSAALFI